MCVIAVYKILKPFVNTLSADEKYSVDNREILSQPVELQLSKKLYVFSRVFFAFLKSKFNFEHFKEKVGPHSFSTSGNYRQRKMYLFKCLKSHV